MAQLYFSGRYLEVNGSVSIRVGLEHELQYLVLRGVLPDTAHHPDQLVCRDTAAAILHRYWIKVCVGVCVCVCV